MQLKHGSPAAVLVGTALSCALALGGLGVAAGGARAATPVTAIAPAPMSPASTAAVTVPVARTAPGAAGGVAASTARKKPKKKRLSKKQRRTRAAAKRAAAKKKAAAKRAAAKRRAAKKKAELAAKQAAAVRAAQLAAQAEAARVAAEQERIRQALVGAEAVVGVATFNTFHDLDPEQAWLDLAALTGRSDVDVVGLQEAEVSAATYASRLPQRGWASVFLDQPGVKQVGVIWRESRFELVGATARQVHPGANRTSVPSTQFPFPSRWIAEVRLRVRATGAVVTVLNTHSNQRAEVAGVPGLGHPTNTLNASVAMSHFATLRELWQSVPGDYVIGTGDYNADFAADSRVRHPGFPQRQFAGRATSSYNRLGLHGVGHTHPRTRRWIDYVWVADDDLDDDVRFVDQRGLAGYRSDHTPVVVRLALLRPTESTQAGEVDPDTAG